MFSAPFVPSKAYLQSLPYGTPTAAVYHGPTSFMSTPQQLDVYGDAKALGIFRQIGAHEFAGVNAEDIVRRILRNRKRYEDRQRNKGVKADAEEEIRRRGEGEREGVALN